MKRMMLILIAVAALAQQPHSTTLTWAWSQGTGDAALGFHIWKSSTSGGPYAAPYATVLGTSTLTFKDAAVVAGQTSYYTVSAFNSAGDSIRSNEVAATTPFQEPTTPSGLVADAK